MSAADVTPNATGSGAMQLVTRWLAPGALLLVLAMQLPLVLNRAINWDEFWHYSQTVLLAQGNLRDPLQTLYTRAFVWVTSLEGTGVDHIIVIRLFMLACELVTLAAIIGLARRFADRNTAWLCALGYLSASYVFQHGTSFRFDPPAAALLTSSLWILACRPLTARWLMLIGLLTGLSTLLTIKSVLYAPAFAGLAWLRWSELGLRREIALRISAIPLLALAAFGLAYLLHSQGLAGDTGSAAGTVVSRSAEKMFSFGVPPYWLATVRAAVFSPLQAILILAVPIALLFSKRPMPERLALLGLWLPMTTLWFYHNTAPYYHVFLLAPVSVSLTAIIPAAAKRFGAPLLTILLFAGAILTLMREPENTIDKQRKLLVAAEQIFGGPVAYFDSCAMIGQFPKANAFLTPWGIHQYLRGGFPAMSDIVDTKVVPLVVDDDYMFAEALNTREAVPTLLPRDTQMLRSTYVRFWGPFWVAGFDLAADSAERKIAVRVPGPYTFHGQAPVTIDGVMHKPGAVFTLARGAHTVAPTAQGGRLIWGRNLKAPAGPAPAEPFFMLF